MSRPHTEQGDPEAQRRLCAGMAPIRRSRPGLQARTRFFDDQVLAAVRAGMPQVVICGAGYDDRALRFRTPGVRFFELDHPATQADKARRLQDMGADLADVVLAPADFRDDDAAAVMAAAGHDASRPTLFLCEGLLIYLDQAVIGRLLAGLRSRAAEGASLAASLAMHPDGLDSGRVVRELNAGRRLGDTEPWLTVLPAPDWMRLLASAGWRVGHQSDPRDGSGDGVRSYLVVAWPLLLHDGPDDLAAALSGRLGGEPAPLRADRLHQQQAAAILGLFRGVHPDRRLRARIPDADDDLSLVRGQPQPDGGMGHRTGRLHPVCHQLRNHELGVVGQRGHLPLPQHVPGVQPRRRYRAVQRAQLQEALQRPLARVFRRVRARGGVAGVPGIGGPRGGRHAVPRFGRPSRTIASVIGRC
jgi:methyltransferase (TIGR00027 family)